jgi:transposase
MDFDPLLLSRIQFGANISIHILFPTITIILCFLHSFLKIRQRAKRLTVLFPELAQKVWEAYRAENHDAFIDKVTVLRLWADHHQNLLSQSAFEAVVKLCQNAYRFSPAYQHPHCYRTSAMLDRHLDALDRYLYSLRYFHGHLMSAERSIRAWALVHRGSNSSIVVFMMTAETPKATHRGPKAPSIELDESSRDELNRLLKRHLTPQQIALRARIVVDAAAGHSNCQIAREHGVSLDTVRLWRERWLILSPIPELSVEERLEDAPRPGRKARISSEQVCQIMALACEKPAESKRPISQWSGSELADEIIRRGIVESISARHALRLLKRGLSNRTSSTTG